METSPTITELAKALQAFQGAVPSIKKDAVNPAFGSKYASLDQMWETVRPILTEHGLSLLQLPEGENTITNLLTHTSGEWVKGTMRLYFGTQARRGQEPVETKVVTPQIHGIAIQYARRYAMAAILGLTADEDDDGNAISGHGKEDKKPDDKKADDPPPTNKISASVLGQVRTWLRNLPKDIREAATHAVFGCSMEQLPNVPQQKATAGLELIRKATARGITWDGPELRQQLDQLYWPNDEEDDIPVGGPPKTGTPPQDRAGQRSALQRELNLLLDQINKTDIPSGMLDAAQSLTVTPNYLADCIEWAKGKIEQATHERSQHGTS